MSRVRRQVRYLRVHDKYICHRFGKHHVVIAMWRFNKHPTFANDKRYYKAGLVKVRLQFAL